MSRLAVLGLLAGLAARLLAAARAVAIAIARRRVLGHLGQLDDRMLRDIGLARQDVWSVSAEPLFRDPTIGLARCAAEGRVADRAYARERLARAALRRQWAEESRAA